MKSIIERLNTANRLVVQFILSVTRTKRALTREELEDEFLMRGDVDGWLSAMKLRRSNKGRKTECSEAGL